MDDSNFWYIHGSEKWANNDTYGVTPAITTINNGGGKGKRDGKGKEQGYQNNGKGNYWQGNNNNNNNNDIRRGMSSLDTR